MQEFEQFVDSGIFESMLQKLTRTARIITLKLRRKRITPEVEQESKVTQRNNQYQIMARNIIYFLIYQTTYNQHPPLVIASKRSHYYGANSDYDADMIANLEKYMKHFISLVYEKFAEQLRKTYNEKEPAIALSASSSSNAAATTANSGVINSAATTATAACDEYNVEDVEGVDDDEDDDDDEEEEEGPDAFIDDATTSVDADLEDDDEDAGMDEVEASNRRGGGGVVVSGGGGVGDGSGDSDVSFSNEHDYEYYHRLSRMLKSTSGCNSATAAAAAETAKGAAAAASSVPATMPSAASSRDEMSAIRKRVPRGFFGIDSDEDDDDEETLAGNYSSVGSSRTLKPINVKRSIKLAPSSVVVVNAAPASATVSSSSSVSTIRSSYTIDETLQNDNVVKKLYLSLLMELNQPKLLMFLLEKIENKRYAQRAVMEVLRECSRKLSRKGIALAQRIQYLDYIENLLKQQCYKDVADKLHNLAIDLEYNCFRYTDVVNPHDDCSPIDLKHFDALARFTRTIYGYSTQTPLNLTTETYVVNNITYDIVKFTRDGESEIFDVRAINRIQLDFKSWKDRLNSIPNDHLPQSYIKITPHKINKINIWSGKLKEEANKTYLYIRTSGLGRGTLFLNIGKMADKRRSKTFPVLNTRHKKLKKDHLYDGDVSEPTAAFGGESYHHHHHHHHGATTTAAAAASSSSASAAAAAAALYNHPIVMAPMEHCKMASTVKSNIVFDVSRLVGSVMTTGSNSMASSNIE